MDYKRGVGQRRTYANLAVAHARGHNLMLSAHNASTPSYYGSCWMNVTGFFPLLLLNLKGF